MNDRAIFDAADRAMVMQACSIHRLCNHVTHASLDRDDLLMLLDSVIARIGRKEGEIAAYEALQGAYREYERFVMAEEEAARIRNYSVKEDRHG